VHTTNDPPVKPEQAAFGELELAQTAKVRAFREKRSADDVAARLTAVQQAAATDANLMPPLIEAVKAGATLGEISDVLRGVWGTYRAVAG
jgi:(2R)-ethylmalonyl-CoA mutase